MVQALRNERYLSVHDLKRRISEGEIDTVLIAFTDMQGRLQGKRLHAAYFVDHVRAVRGHERDADARTPVQVEVVDLGDADLELAAQVRDQRTYQGPLLLE